MRMSQSILATSREGALADRRPESRKGALESRRAVMISSPHHYERIFSKTSGAAPDFSALKITIYRNLLDGLGEKFMNAAGGFKVRSKMERLMPYFVSWIKDGRVRRFAYPHTDLETALAFASEVFEMDCSDVWISDENRQKVADQRAVAQYAEEKQDNY
jgi:hypothetical protein